MTHIMHLLFIFIFLGLGYVLGKITCNAHFKKSGIWITLALFAIINGLHSFIDGTSLAGITSSESIWLMIGHEVIRQPMLYVLFLGMMAPFTLSKTMRFGSAFIAVTGIWALTVFLGSLFGVELAHMASIEPFLDYFKYIFIGDIIHHAVDYFAHKAK